MDHDAPVGKPLGPQLGEDHLASLGSRIGDRTPVLPASALEIPDPDSLGVHTAGRDIDDSGRGRCCQPGNQQIGEQEVAEQVGGKRQLVAFCRLAAVQ